MRAAKPEQKQVHLKAEKKKKLHQLSWGWEKMKDREMGKGVLFYFFLSFFLSIWHRDRERESLLSEMEKEEKWREEV